MSDAIDDRPIPIDLTPYQEMVMGSKEFLRMWAKENGPVTCFVNPVPLGPDPAALGVALVDCIQHGARAYSAATGIPEAEALKRIWEGVDAERANPSDIATPLPQGGDDGLIQ